VYDNRHPRAQEITNPFYIGMRLFRRQLAYLSARYEFVGAAEAAEWLMGGAALPDRPLLLTFDDGYGGFYRDVYPILRSRGIPAMVSPITGWVDGEIVPWDILFNRAVNRAAADRLVIRLRGEEILLAVDSARRRREAFDFLCHLYVSSPGTFRRRLIESLVREVPTALEEDGILTSLRWGEIEEMAGNGIEFGCHTHTHAVLAGLVDVEVREELSTSRKRLADRLGRDPVAFTYPAGRQNGMVRAQVGEAGFRFALRSSGERARREGDRLLVPRIGIRGNDTMAEFIFKTSGLSSIVGRIARGLTAGVSGRTVRCL
jgi:peptidoglycan/xylan/chitin deacetylase (PgdA/CDA1 family)